MGVLEAGSVSRARTAEEPQAGEAAVRALLAEIVAAPLGEVVTRRDAAVRRLRAEGRRDDAERVARLRRPSPALWAVDRLHEVDRVALREVLAGAGAVRDAQSDLLRGRAGAAGRLTAAGRDLSAAVGRAARSALGLLAAEGHGAGAETERRIQSLLRAAALGDDATRAALEEGRLTEEPQPEGFGGADEVAPPPAAPARATPGAAPAGAPGGSLAAAQARARRLELERAVVVRRGAAAEAERAGAASRARAASSRAELLALETRVEQLRERLAAEEAELRSAEERAAETRAALERAITALE